MSSGHARWFHRGSGFMQPLLGESRHPGGGRRKLSSWDEVPDFSWMLVGCMEEKSDVFDTCWLEKLKEWMWMWKVHFLHSEDDGRENRISALCFFGKALVPFLSCVSCVPVCAPFVLSATLSDPWMVDTWNCMQPISRQHPKKNKESGSGCYWNLAACSLYITKGISIANMPKIDSQEPKLCQQLPRSSLPRRTELVNSLSYPTIYPPRERSDIPPPGSSESHLD